MTTRLSLTLIIFFPFFANALTNPFQPLGTEQNPIYFQEVKSDNQTIKDIDKSINDNIQKAQDILRRGSGVPYNNIIDTEKLLERARSPQYVPSTPYTPSIQKGTGDYRLDAILDDAILRQYDRLQDNSENDALVKCIEQPLMKWRNGRCVTQTEACVIDWGPHSHPTGPTSCGCNEGYKPGVDLVTEFPNVIEACILIAQPQQLAENNTTEIKRPSFLRWFLGLFGI